MSRTRKARAMRRLEPVPPAQAEGTPDNPVPASFRLLRSEVGEQEIQYHFDLLRFRIERQLSHPLTIARYDPQGGRIGGGTWDEAKTLLREVDEVRRKIFGVTFLDQQRLVRSQSEMRTLAAQCSAFRDDFREAIRELRLALSGLDLTHPTDRFLCAVIHGHAAETYLLRADRWVRRRWPSSRNPPAAGPEFRRGDALAESTDGAGGDGIIPNAEDRQRYEKTVGRRRQQAMKDLRLASASLDTSVGHIRAVRPNVSRWEWLHEIRAQLIVERVLLQALDLDFSIDLPTDDWQFIGNLQSEVTEGLEAIRAGLDCTLYTDPRSASSGDGDMKWSQTIHKRLLGLWMQIMIGSFWVLRFFAQQPSHQRRTDFSRRIAPRLAAVEMFDMHGSRRSFWDRWTALNEAAGLERLVSDEAGEVASGVINQSGTTGGPPPCSVKSYPFFLREFVLEEMAKLYGPPEDHVKAFQDALAQSRSDPDDSGREGRHPSEAHDR